jgi:hypothetical protein
VGCLIHLPHFAPCLATLATCCSDTLVMTAASAGVKLRFVLPMYATFAGTLGCCLALARKAELVEAEGMQVMPYVHWLPTSSNITYWV